MQDLLGAAYPAFETALSALSPVSVRLHPLKCPSLPADIAGLQPGVQVPWHPLGYYLPERPVFTLDPRLHAGAYYVQEASSMFLYAALRQIVSAGTNLKILDLCAAPGGKSTLLSAFTGKDGLLVSNEYVRSRVGILRENLERWGLENVAVTSADAAAYAKMEGWFDVVAVDAPCSGEGLFRKDPDAVKEWSPQAVESCALRQKDILHGAVQALAPGGILLYSTCTYNRQENEENVRYLCEKYPLELVPLDIPAAWGIASNTWGHHFYPHRLQGEGFFISVLRKKEGPAVRHNLPSAFQHLKPLSKNQVPELYPWVSDAATLRFYKTPQEEIIALPAAQEPDFLLLDKVCNSKWFGVKLGAFKGRDFIPDHALALSTLRSPKLPLLDLQRNQAIQFLRKESLDLPENTPRGWVLAAFEGLPLGWMKVLPNRMNNYLPQERRIRLVG